MPSPARSRSTPPSSPSTSSSSDAVGAARGPRRRRGRRTGRRAAGAQAPPGWATRGGRAARPRAGAGGLDGRRPRASARARRAGGPESSRLRTEDAIADLERATEHGDNVAFASARARAWTALLHTGLLGAVTDARRGDAAAARRWLLVREFRAPTRFTRAGTDATVALAGLARGDVTPAAAARAVRADLLDTYDARLHATLAERARRRQARVRRPPRRGGCAGPRLRPHPRGQLPVAARRRSVRAVGTSLARLEGADVVAAVGSGRRQLEGFRAAPLAPAEQARRAGQLDRFLRLVPIEYDRGVEGSRVTLPFEIQEAISFRDAAAARSRRRRPHAAGPRRRRDARADGNPRVARDDARRGRRGRAVAQPSTSRPRPSARST